ncbi:branched-chain amino acid ABC transporter permease [Duganella sp. FT92W]|uniref:Branched-chain amino acid ABC transporter permease n=1 Tax=Pseudoduganella rivuli TaxID=2666085 RepID=A0A7X2IIG3_9BURK|nr:branched-chain amino acid ABC transporter permease [Pseudoduganella rivuli]MRV70405.1 branched-chain amino acid ABC transporter permease [Pseudoduganella rivuli]
MSLTLLAQSALGGMLHGGIYALLALGLSLSWGLLRLVNLSHFALAFLGAYLAYHCGTTFGWPIWLSALVIPPVFFIGGLALHALLVRFQVSEFASMLVTFGVTILIESLIQWIWSADFRTYETPYAQESLRLGPLFVPVLELLAFTCAAVLATAAWLGLNKTSWGKALRAAAHDGAIAAAFGINARRLSYLLAGLCAASAGIAGIFIALTSTLAPSQIEAWIGVVFAVVIIGGLANPVGALLAGMLIGVSEAITMAAVNPAWAPLVAFSILIILLLWKPKWL